MLLPPFLQKWILLNVLRLLTLTSCSLVIASTILILRNNFRNLHPSASSSTLPTVTSGPLDYEVGTDIPTQVWGVLWSTLHHVYNLLALFLIVLSEVSWGGYCDRFFDNVLPFLGREWGTQMMGALMILLGADTLSRKIGRFALISNWLLVSVGFANILSGIAFHSRGKLLRSPMGFKRPMAEKLEKLAEARAKAEKVKDVLLPLPVTTAQRNDSAETMVGTGPAAAAAAGATAAKVVVDGLWKKFQSKGAEDGGDATADTMAEKSAGGAMASLPPAVPFQPGMPPPPPPVLLPSAAIAIASGAASTATTNGASGQLLQPTAVPNATSEKQTTLKRSASHHRAHSTDFLIVNAPPSPPPLTNTPPMQVRESSDAKESRPTADETETQAATQYLLALPADTHGQGMMMEERSPGVLAKFRAAELEAKVKAKRRAEKKSLYLGSQRWLESRSGGRTIASGDEGWCSDATSTTTVSEAGRGLPPYRRTKRADREELLRGGREDRPARDEDEYDADESFYVDATETPERRGEGTRSASRSTVRRFEPTPPASTARRAQPRLAPLHLRAPSSSDYDTEQGDADDDDAEECLVTPTPLQRHRRHEVQESRARRQPATDSEDDFAPPRRHMQSDDEAQRLGLASRRRPQPAEQQPASRSRSAAASRHGRSDDEDTRGARSDSEVRMSVRPVAAARARTRQDRSAVAERNQGRNAGAPVGRKRSTKGVGKRSYGFV